MAAAKALHVKQSADYEGDDWWSWSIWIDGPKAELDRITCVEYTLHPTFRDPVRTVTNRRQNFKLSTGGWGVFPIHVRVVKKDGTEAELLHQLTLYYPTGEANTA